MTDAVVTAEIARRSGDRLEEEGMLDEASRAGLIDDAESVLYEGVRSPLPSSPSFVEASSKHVSWGVEAIAGSRREARGRVKEDHGFSCGARRVDRHETGFVRFQGRGFLRCVHAGGMTMRFGNRLILGRGFGRYASSDEGAVRGTIAISPSYSEWFGVSGTAAEFGCAPIRLGAVLMGPPEGFDRWRPNTMWAWGVAENRRCSFGVVLGRPAGTSAEGAGSDFVKGPGAASVHLAFRGDAFAASGELACLDGPGAFYAARLADQGRGNRFGYSLFVYRAPHDPPFGPAGIVPAPSTDQGARLDGWTRIGNLRPSVSFVDAAWSSPTRRTSYRRAILRIETDGRNPVAWDVATDLTEAAEERYPFALVDRDLTCIPKREWRTRVELSAGATGQIVPSMRVDYIPGMDGTGPAILLVLSTEVVTERVDWRLQLAVHELSPGRRAFIWRPGIGSFENFASLYSNGSDLAWSIRVRLAGAGRFVASYGSAWPDRNSLNLGIEYGR
jgi:hypothetical protein